MDEPRIDPVLKLADLRRRLAQSCCEPCRHRIENQIRALEAEMAGV